MKNDRLLQQLGQLVLVAPALVGVFWGAPLVARELENNTFRLAWTQSVSRTRWLAIELGLVGLASMVTAGLLSLMVTWWSSPFDRITDSPFSPSSFDRRDLVPSAMPRSPSCSGLSRACSSAARCPPWRPRSSPSSE